MSITLRNCSGVSRVAGTAVPTPALLTSTSALPSSATVSRTTRSQSSGSETSASIARQRRPCASTRSLVVCEAVGAAGADRDVGAGLGEAVGERDAEAGGGAGDDGHLAVEAEAVDEAHGPQRMEGSPAMPRPVTLFTGQWADLPIAELAAKCGEWGFDGLELASWGDHFDVARALEEPDYCDGVRKLLESHGLGCWAISNHLVGQAVCDPIDARHEAILPPEVWGDGDPDGVRSRAAERMKDTARAAARLGVQVVTGFTGSPVWHMLYSFPPNDFAEIERGYERFAEAWGPIVDVFDAEGVRFALEVHPTEIAYDFVTTRKALAALGHRPGFGINFDPSHLEPQLLDSAAFVDEFAAHIHHVHVKDSKRRLDGRRSILGSHLNFGDADRGWDFVSPGHGDVDFESILRALNRAGYEGPLSIEWEDSGMDREYGARDALAFVRRTDFPPSGVAFDAAFARED